MQKNSKMKKVFKGMHYNIYQEEVTLPSGQKKIFEYYERVDTVIILPLLDPDTIILIKEKRPAYDQPVFGLPAGRCDDASLSPEEHAQKELQEEADYKAGRLTKLFEPYESNTAIYRIHVFVAQDLIASSLEGDEDEEIEAVPIPLAEAVKMALDGRIVEPTSAYSILRLAHDLKNGKIKA